MKIFSVKKETILFVASLLVISIELFKIYKDEAVTTFYIPVSKKVIVIDSGRVGRERGAYS